MYDDRGRLVDKAGPSNAVQVFVLLLFCTPLPMITSKYPSPIYLFKDFLILQCFLSPHVEPFMLLSHLVHFSFLKR
jgi:hypothetical protein